MRIVILDAYTANPGDLTWNALRTLGDCTIHDRTSSDELIARARDVEVILTNKVVLDADTLAKLPKLKCVGVLATGTNVVDLAAATTRDIVVTNVPAYSTASVAQAVFALLLELALHVDHHSRRVHDGAWSQSRDFSFAETPLVELEGLTLGIVGLGTIGRSVARIAEAFGMQVIATVRTPRDTDSIRQVDLPTLLDQSDVVSLHCPLTDATHHLIDASSLRLMKPGAYLINTARGPLVDEQALADTLNTGQIAGAGLDVLSSEPPATDNPLIGAKNCVITPHTAWATQAARRRLINVATSNVQAFLAGKPVNVVN